MQRPDGTTFMDFDYYNTLREKFLQILYDGLPDKSYIRTGCNVQSITQHADSVDVTLADGSVETGDMILGVDGVSSLTRTSMWDHADKVSPGLITQKDKTCMKTSYRGLIGIGPQIPNLRKDVLITTFDEKLTFLTLTQKEQVFWLVLFRLPETMVWPQRGRWTEKDAEEQAAKIASHPLTKECKFEDLWNTRERGALVPMEEGLLDRWYHDRIVLAGDAAHKVTPNLALGGNSAMESVVVLCNLLQKMVAGQENARPSLETLTKAFAAYQNERHGRMKVIVDLSARATRMEAWDHMLDKFVTTRVMPYIPHHFLVKQLGRIITPAPKLDYVSLEGFARGKTPWKYDDGVEC
ncbi:hypothetical protein SLS62_010493 [Diatrype stigma]|uniref:FAD-binding domain-containing protein n=1 Tax=Diatrype stigma TaxID=117547 RepID=A0AAN9UGI5_9PEZI